MIKRIGAFLLLMIVLLCCACSNNDEEATVRQYLTEHDWAEKGNTYSFAEDGDFTCVYIDIVGEYHEFEGWYEIETGIDMIHFYADDSDWRYTYRYEEGAFSFFNPSEKELTPVSKSDVITTVTALMAN